MGHQDPAEAIRQLIAQCAVQQRATAMERRVTPDRRASPSNAAPVIVVVGNGNVITPAPPPDLGAQS